MKILLVGNYLPDKQESMIRFANFLNVELGKRNIDVQLWIPNERFGALTAHPFFKKWLAYIDKYILAIASLRRAARKAELVHITDHANAVYGPLLGNQKWMITCHDLLAIRICKGEFPAMKTGTSGRMLQKWIQNSIAKAPHTVCVSEATLKDLHRLNPENKSVSIIKNGLNHPYSRLNSETLRERLKTIFNRLGHNPPLSYLLHIGGNQWYKNRIGVIKLFNELKRLPSSKELILVLAGKNPTPELIQEVSFLGLEKSIIWLENLTNEELEALYNGSKSFLFPSLAEGFGWPIAEALSCGCPVITSNRPPMTEVGGSVCCYINPEDLKDAARIVNNYLNSERIDSEEAILNRIQHTAQFHPSLMIDSYVSCYRSLLS
jgi:glycosyltransferase involved in cell wall biosynthesis